MRKLMIGVQILAVLCLVLIAGIGYFGDRMDGALMFSAMAACLVCFVVCCAIAFVVSTIDLMRWKK